MTCDGGPVSASRLAEELGDQLPRASDVTPAAFELVARVRELLDAVVLTDAEPQVRSSAAAAIADVTAASRPDAAITT